MNNYHLHTSRYIIITITSNHLLESTQKAQTRFMGTQIPKYKWLDDIKGIPICYRPSPHKIRLKWRFCCKWPMHMPQSCIQLSRILLHLKKCHLVAHKQNKLAWTPYRVNFKHQFRKEIIGNKELHRFIDCPLSFSRWMIASRNQIIFC